tara:strand:+ start:15829 stop:16677 length:849 start_codon:yes stop_codon:yes gene_type:complete
LSSTPSPEILQAGQQRGISISDPTRPGIADSYVIGTKDATRYGRRVGDLSPIEVQNIVGSGAYPIVGDPTDPSEMFIEVTDTPIEGRKGEVAIDVKVAVTGKDAFDQMMNAFKNDDGTWEQIAEGLFFNDFIVPEEDFSEIYEYENVANGMLAAVRDANAFAQAGGAGLGRAPTIDALLKSTDPEALQKKFNEITKSKKAPQYSRNTIIAMAEQAASTHLQRGLSNEQMQAVVAAVHALPTDQKMNIGSEVGAIVSGLDSERAAGVKAYNSAQNVKNALGLK